MKRLMKRRTELRLEAELDLLNAAQVHEEARPGYGARFLDEVDACLKKIATAPLSFPPVEGDVRKAFLRRFKYAVLFRVVDEATIDVLGVLHHHQHEDTWRNR